MSRANPTALRIASKTQSSMFIGVSGYYFYDHLKETLNILKLTNLIGKQIVLPTNKLFKLKANSENLTVLTPHLLPINTAFGAKQLFSTKFRLNKRRFSAVTLHYISWLKDDFNKNYKRFNTGTGFIKYGKTYKFENLPKKKPHARTVNAARPRYLQKNYTGPFLLQEQKFNQGFSNTTKANQISDIYKYFVFKRPDFQKKEIVQYTVETSDSFLNCLVCLSSSALKWGSSPFCENKSSVFDFQLLPQRGTNSLTKRHAPLNKYTDKKESILFYSKLLYMQNFKKMQIVMEKYVNSLPLSSKALKNNSHPLLLQKQKLPKMYDACYLRPDYKDITNSMLLLGFLSLLYSQSKKIQTRLLATQVSYADQLSARQQKMFLNTEKPGQFINVNNYLDSTVDNNLSTKYSYVLSPYSGVKNPNYSSFSKVQNHINFFSVTGKGVIPLELVIYRSFCEPAGLNYFTALDNRLSKSRFNSQYSSTLFKRTSNNGFIPNYTNTQTGLIRLKAQIIFEFLYNFSSQSESVVEQNSFLKNHRRMLSSNTAKLWVRKGSTIRL